ncbi:MAG: flippase-like domain-containing protein [Proteobacteria bacterium]|jgi:glycosyltransferase 2 family protein|nr:flippase-like domain-containing protein [Pseudomonadota bacterium]
MKSSAKYGLKLLFSLLIFGLALSQVDWMQVRGTLLAASGVWLALHVGSLVLERMVFTWKWLILIHVFDRSIGFARLLANTLIGKLWGTFLPSSLGVDVVRAYYLNRDVNNPGQVTASVLCDKLLALVALILMALLGLWQCPPELQHAAFRVALIGGAGLVVLLVYACVNKLAAHWGSKLLANIGLTFISQFVQRVSAAMQTYRGVPTVLLWSFLGSCALQLVRVLSVWFMAIALGLELPFSFLLLVVPLSMILIMLPLSIGGIGLREGIFVGMFSLVGLAPSDGFALGLATTLTDLLLSLAGGIVYLRVTRDSTAQ